MQEKVVYLLGAGFSVPLGLPMVSNFITMSKDLYWGDQGRFSTFVRVFKLLNDMARAKNYYRTDLFSIEEVLSILEMEDVGTGNSTRTDQFATYICDTIKARTPSFDRSGPLSEYLITSQTNPNEGLYIQFVAKLFRQVLNLDKSLNESRANADTDTDTDSPSTLYSLLTLNYDTVLEKSLDRLNEVTGPRLEFQRAGEPFPEGKVSYAKLHGSVDTGTIILPTWNKTLPSSIHDAWQLAFKALAQATQVRIIGYSMPSADAYFRYLLKAAVLQSEHLKNIDILCYDPDGSVRERYRDTIAFTGARFLDSTTEKYLSRQRISMSMRAIDFHQLLFPTLESDHNALFGQATPLLSSQSHRD
jgi:hypothetical protein